MKTDTITPPKSWTSFERFKQLWEAGPKDGNELERAWIHFAECANGLQIQEQETEKALRANLERLAERWKTRMQTPDFEGALYSLHFCELMIVLSGETPPAPGEEWK